MFIAAVSQRLESPDVFQHSGPGPVFREGERSAAAGSGAAEADGTLSLSARSFVFVMVMRVRSSAWQH